MKRLWEGIKRVWGGGEIILTRTGEQGVCRCRLKTFCCRFHCHDFTEDRRKRGRGKESRQDTIRQRRIEGGGGFNITSEEMTTLQVNKAVSPEKANPCILRC